MAYIKSNEEYFENQGYSTEKARRLARDYENHKGQFDRSTDNPQRYFKDED